MQAMTMIDSGAAMAETIVPARKAEPQGKNFGQVMKEQHRAEQSQPAEPRQPEGRSQAQEAGQAKVVERERPEPRQENSPQVETASTAKRRTVAGDEAKTEDPKIQQTLIQLMKAINGQQKNAASQEGESVEELLNGLVEQLEQGELSGEGILAGIDLSALQEQLQSSDEEGKLELLSQLGEQLGLQLELAMPQGTTLTGETAALTDNSQPEAVKLSENLGQARQILQQAIDAVTAKGQAGQNVTEVAEVASADTKAQESLIGASSEATEDVDPRFAGLLKPRTEAQPQQAAGQKVVAAEAAPKAANEGMSATVQPQSAEVVEASAAKDFADLLKPAASKQGLENLVQQAQGQAPQLQPQERNIAAMPQQTPVVTLPSGQQVAESQIFDQVVTHISGSQNGESGRMVLRLQPAELGSLKLELMVEGDRVKANLQAQSTQVQEVIERNLPQLRNALAEQGLKIDQFQVNIDKGDQQGQFEQMARQQQEQNSSRQPAWQQEADVEEQIVPLAHLIQNGGEGISLRV